LVLIVNTFFNLEQVISFACSVYVLTMLFVIIDSSVSIPLLQHINRLKPLITNTLSRALKIFMIVCILN